MTCPICLQETTHPDGRWPWACFTCAEMYRAATPRDRLLFEVIALDGEQEEAPDLSSMAQRARAILAGKDAA